MDGNHEVTLTFTLYEVAAIYTSVADALNRLSADIDAAGPEQQAFFTENMDAVARTMGARYAVLDKIDHIGVQ